MGDNLLMKKHILLLFSAYLILGANDNVELSWVDEQVEAIKPPREGLKVAAVNHLKDPFIFLDKNKSEKKTDGTNRSTHKMADSIIPLGIVKSQTDMQTIVTDKEPAKTLSVDAIINKSALINGKWYVQEDVVQGYTIKQVHKTSIVLSKNDKDLVLSTNSKNLNLKFKNK